MALFLAANSDGLSATYLDNPGLEKLLREMQQNYSTVVQLTNLASTAQSNAIWLVELGQGTAEERSRRPAMLVSAGLEGNDLVGTAACVEWMQQLTGGTNQAELARLLGTTTLYVLPRVNPDAAARFFMTPTTENTLNTRATDDDHDGLLEEDGPDDLNGDGMITSMRVEDPAGDYILDSVEPRLLLKADKAKGEQGAWRLLSEGRDSDKDEAWNEDGPGGVNPNRNFPYDYRFFAPGTGTHQVSEPETRAVVEFVIRHPNIGIGVTFGAADNLLQTPKSDAPKRPPVTIRQEDLGFYRELGKTYRDILGLKKELSGSSEPGTLSDWLYYHRGRLSLALQPWSPALQAERVGKAKEGDAKNADSKDGDKKAGDKKEDDDAAKKDSPEKAGDKKSEDKSRGSKGSDSRNDSERAFLHWIDKNAPAAFVPWQRIEHPDFPGQVVEVGGFAPFARSNPPAGLLEELIKVQAAFLTTIAGKLPRIAIRKVKVKPLGESVFELTITVENTGYLPTALGQGEVTQEVHPTRLTVLVDDAAVLAGVRQTVVETIPGAGGTVEVKLVVHAKNRTELRIEVQSMLGGSVATTADLRPPTP